MATVTVTEQDSWPPRTQVAVTGMNVGDNLSIYRVVAGQWTLLRGGEDAAVGDTSFVVIDAELPFGVPVRYAVYVNGAETLTTPETYTLPGGQVAITDAITGAVAEAIIGAAGDKVRGRDSARFRVGGGRNVVVSGPLGQPEGSYDLLAMTTSIAEGIQYVIETATQGIVQIRQPGTTGADGNTYDGVDAYLAVDRLTIRRWSQDGSDPRRVVTIEFAEVSGWSADLLARGFTLADLANYFPGGDLADLAAFFAPAGTLLDVALADWTP